MAVLCDAVEPEREDQTVECCECRCTLSASAAVIRERTTASDRGVLSVKRTYYCSADCAEQLHLEGDHSAAEAATDGGEEVFATLIQRTYGREKRPGELPASRSAIAFLNALCNQVESRAPLSTLYNKYNLRHFINCCVTQSRRVKCTPNPIIDSEIRRWFYYSVM